jgi:hypothetical protein
MARSRVFCSIRRPKFPPAPNLLKSLLTTRERRGSNYLLLSR